MKLATLNDGSRDGVLLVVSRDGSKAVKAAGIADTMQQALDNWAELAPQLNTLSARLNNGELENALALDVSQLAAPLPRAYQFVDGSAYLAHVERVRKARGAEMPPSFLHDPLMYQAVEDALDHIQLITILNDVSLRNLIPSELAKGFGFLQSKPRSALAPFFVTPDELAEAWRAGKVHLPLRSELNGEWFGEPDAGVDMQFNFGELIAHAARTRPLAAGTIVGSGTIANQDMSAGSSCLAEKRVLEIIEKGAAETPFMSYGDRIRIEMRDKKGENIFGTIEQKVVPA